nr:ribbon-helix-helix protein, CopG family [Solirubrobacterales bacterium]
TLTIDGDVLKAIKVRAARAGRGDSEVIEEALRRDLGIDFLERMWGQSSLPATEADALALEAQHDTRLRRRS